MSGTWNTVLGSMQSMMTGSEEDLAREDSGGVFLVSGFVFM